ncbi:MAG: hypothetical protein ACRC20_07635 [Segniliparus sp.]|uniref:hypothetical protein n=1 Tax=Segniliparus sp. TaxID=2804064 RepID=UPI003F36F94C
MGLMEAAAEGFFEAAGWAEAMACRAACGYERLRAMNAARSPDDPLQQRVFAEYRDALGPGELPPVGFTRRMLEAMFDRAALALWEHAAQAGEEASALLAAARAWAKETEQSWTGVDWRRDGYDALARENGGDELWRTSREDIAAGAQGWFVLPEGLAPPVRHWRLSSALQHAFPPDVLRQACGSPYAMLQDLRPSKEAGLRLSLEYAGEPMADLFELVIAWHCHAGDLLNELACRLAELHGPWLDALWLYMETGVWLLRDGRDLTNLDRS